MIVREIAGSLWLFDQMDHSEICGQIATAWGAAPFATVSAAIREAARSHDSGWVEWDRFPRLDPQTGRPHSYSGMPADDYREIWARGLENAWRAGSEEGLLVSLHAMRFFERKHAISDRQLLARERARQRDALSRLGYVGASATSLPQPYSMLHEWMFFWDAVSLFMCEGWSSPWTQQVPVGIVGSPLTVSVARFESNEPGGNVQIQPQSLRFALELIVPVRLIPLMQYRTQQDLDAAIGEAERRAVHWRFDLE